MVTLGCQMNFVDAIAARLSIVMIALVAAAGVAFAERGVEVILRQSLLPGAPAADTIKLYAKSSSPEKFIKKLTSVAV